MRKARRLRHVDTDEMINPTVLVSGRHNAPGEEFHIFLSHAWKTGQDQMRVVKSRLQEMMPVCKVFLDVDDLQRKKGKGAQLVDQSRVFLLFCSAGFFTSPNCLREVLRGVLREKKFLILLEPDQMHGRLTREEAIEQLRRIEADGKYEDASWSGGKSLKDEMEEWGGTIPSADELEEILFETPPIPWDRIGFFQDVSMRLIAERVLPKTLEDKTYLQGDLIHTSIHVPPPYSPRRHHLFCSRHNWGAEDIIGEVEAHLQERPRALVSMPSKFLTVSQFSFKRVASHFSFNPSSSNIQEGLRETMGRSPHLKQHTKDLNARKILFTDQLQQMSGCHRFLLYLCAAADT